MRRMVAPGRWVDEGPHHAVSAHSPFAARAVTIPAMVPVLTNHEPNPVTSDEYRRRQKRLAKTRAEKPTCGAFMPLAATTCARMPGHADSHRSRETMDADTAMRRTNWRAVGAL